MAISVQSIIERVQATLQDTTGLRWPVVAELELWINDAQREISLIKPDATAKNESVALVAGTKQTIPENGNRLLNVIRNMSSAATDATGGRAIRGVDRETLDSQTPDWHNPSVTGYAAHTSVVKHFMYDDSNPRNFYVYPGVNPNAYIEIVYSANPETVATSSGVTPWVAGELTYDANTPTFRVHNNVKYVLKQTTASSGDEPGTTEGDAHWTKVAITNLAVPDIFANAIMNYVLYMAYTKESEFAANAQRASTHYGLFTNALVGKAAVDQATQPIPPSTVRSVQQGVA